MIAKAAGDSSIFVAKDWRQTLPAKASLMSAVWPLWQVYPFFGSWEVLRNLRSSSHRNGHGLQKSTAIRPRDYRGNAFGTAVPNVEIVSVGAAVPYEVWPNDLTSGRWPPTAIGPAVTRRRIRKNSDDDEGRTPNSHDSGCRGGAGTVNGPESIRRPKYR